MTRFESVAEPLSWSPKQAYASRWTSIVSKDPEQLPFELAERDPVVPFVKLRRRRQLVAP
jgi:hypothetical protein